MAISIFVMSSRGRLRQPDWIKVYEKMSQLSSLNYVMMGYWSQSFKIYLESQRSIKWVLLLPVTVQVK